jgi:hypothetical protein
MANASPHGQSHTSHTVAGTIEQAPSWPPPGRLLAPAIVEARGRRHRKTRPQPAKPAQPPRGRNLGRTPAPIPPHPPLVSGGWYRSQVRSEVLGPGRYPLRSPADKSIGVALALGALLGPGGLCYTSFTAGLIAIGVTAIALILVGFAALLVVWPISIAAAAISAELQHRWYERQ